MPPLSAELAAYLDLDLLALLLSLLEDEGDHLLDLPLLPVIPHLVTSI